MNYHHALHNIPEERRFHLFCGGSLESRGQPIFSKDQAYMLVLSFPKLSARRFVLDLDGVRKNAFVFALSSGMKISQ